MPKVYLTTHGVIKALVDTPTDLKGFNVISEQYIEIKKSECGYIELTESLAKELFSEKAIASVCLAVTDREYKAANVSGYSERGFQHLKKRVGIL